MNDRNRTRVIWPTKVKSLLSGLISENIFRICTEIQEHQEHQVHQERQALPGLQVPLGHLVIQLLLKLFQVHLDHQALSDSLDL